MKTVAILAALLLALGLPSAASAAILTFLGPLSGGAEATPNSSPGAGNAVVTVDTVANTMRIEIAFGGLVSPTTVAHLHCCAAPGSAAGVATAIPTFPGFPEGVTSGAYDQTFDLMDAATYNPAFVMAAGGVSGALAALLAGFADGEVYANVHTVMFPGGELRANLNEIPLPAAALMFAAGLVALYRRRRAV